MAILRLLSQALEIAPVLPLEPIPAHGWDDIGTSFANTSPGCQQVFGQNNQWPKLRNVKTLAHDFGKGSNHRTVVVSEENERGEGGCLLEVWTFQQFQKLQVLHQVWGQARPVPRPCACRHARHHLRLSFSSCRCCSLPAATPTATPAATSTDHSGPPSAAATRGILVLFPFLHSPFGFHSKLHKMWQGAERYGGGGRQGEALPPGLLHMLRVREGPHSSLPRGCRRGRRQRPDLLRGGLPCPQRAGVRDLREAHRRERGPGPHRRQAPHRVLRLQALWKAHRGCLRLGS